MFKKNLCSRCKMGQYTYALDKRAPECPYISCHNGKKCGMYKKLDKSKNHGILATFISKLKVVPPPKNKPIEAF